MSFFFLSRIQLIKSFMRTGSIFLCLELNLYNKDFWRQTWCPRSSQFTSYISLWKFKNSPSPCLSCIAYLNNVSPPIQGDNSNLLDISRPFVSADPNKRGLKIFEKKKSKENQKKKSSKKQKFNLVDFWLVFEINIFFTPKVFLLQIITILLQFSYCYF